MSDMCTCMHAHAHTHTLTHIRAALLPPSCSECVGIISLNHSLNGTKRKLFIQGTVLLFVVISCVVALDLTVYTLEYINQMIKCRIAVKYIKCSRDHLIASVSTVLCNPEMVLLSIPVKTEYIFIALYSSDGKGLIPGSHH
jgi:hypothetical protein